MSAQQKWSIKHYEWRHRDWLVFPKYFHFMKHRRDVIRRAFSILINFESNWICYLKMLEIEFDERLYKANLFLAPSGHTHTKQQRIKISVRRQSRWNECWLESIMKHFCRDVSLMMTALIIHWQITPNGLIALFVDFSIFFVFFAVFFTWKIDDIHFIFG